jgi:hypothetical protein
VAGGAHPQCYDRAQAHGAAEGYLSAHPKRLRFLSFNTAGRIIHHACRLTCRIAVPAGAIGHISCPYDSAILDQFLPLVWLQVCPRRRSNAFRPSLPTTIDLSSLAPQLLPQKSGSSAPPPIISDGLRTRPSVSASREFSIDS